MTKINRQWRLVSRPVGLIKDSDFEWREESVSQLQEGEVLVRNIYLSLDPANRGWMREQESYIPPVPLGEVMRGIALGVVEDSKSPNFQVGDLVQGMIGWQDYAVLHSKTLTPIPKGLPIPLTTYMGLLGHIGLTAYFGLIDVTNPQPGETLVVSAAAGAVGSIVGQIGKIKGCHVVGIAGSDEKCQWLKDELGFDGVINYKKESVYNRLKELCPKGIDIYFDNVGGEILDAVLACINKKGRISICGLISMYNAEKAVPGPYNFVNILAKSVKVEGFIVMDYLDRTQEAMAALGQWFMEGKLKYKVDVIEGLEKTPQAINKLFDGSNQGKLIIKVSEEPK
jgi:NADPH-dependent curcumin reductase CurA